MKIWLLQTGEPLPLTDQTRVMRSGHLAFALAKRGHEVVWWASLFNHYSKSWEDFGPKQEILIRAGVRIRALRGTGYKRNVSIKRFVDHALVARAFTKAAQKAERPDLIVAALPDHKLAYAAFLFAQENNIPFVVDLRDRWPWDLVQLLPAKFRWAGRLALAQDFTRTRRLLQGADSLISMMESWGGWIRDVVGRNANANDRVFLLGAPHLHSNPEGIRPSVAAAMLKTARDWNILFVGAFNKNYWPRIVPEIIAEMRAQCGHDLLVGNGQKLRFILAGDGDYIEDMRALAEKDPAIVLPGYVNDAEIFALMAHSKVALVTANGDFHAFPNKVFTYMSGGLPIVSNLGYEFAEMIEREAIGVYCRSAKSAAIALLDFASDEPKRLAFSARCRDEFASKHDSELIYERYCEHLEAVASKRS